MCSTNCKLVTRKVCGRPVTTEQYKNPTLDSKYSQFLPAKDLMNRICSTRRASPWFPSCQSDETPHNYSKHQVKSEPNRHVMPSLVQRCFFRKSKWKHICCKKCQRFGIHNLTFIYIQFLGSIKKNNFFYGAINFQYIFLWSHKKIKMYKLFFYGSTKLHLKILWGHKKKYFFLWHHKKIKIHKLYLSPVTIPPKVNCDTQIFV